MRTLKSRIIHSLSWLVISSVLLNGCVVDPVDPKKEKKKGEMNIEISLEGDIRIFNDCSYLQAFMYDLGSGLGYNHALTIRGVTDNGDKGAVLVVYFNEAQDLQSGTVYASAGDDFGTKPYFTGQVMPDLNSPDNFAGYSSLFLDVQEALNSDGRITFTKYDQTNGFISGNFSFKAQEVSLTGAGTKIVEVTGTFENIVLFPSLDAANQCYGGPTLPNAPDPGSGNPNPSPNPNPNPNPNPAPGNNAKTNANFKNNTFTPITLTVGGLDYTINAGATTTIQGQAGVQSSYSAKTAGKTTSGTQVGLAITWSGNFTYPASGSYSVNLDVSGQYFFLKVINNSSLQMTKIYVNHGLQSQTLDNVTIANNGQLFNLGYYQAYTNSNVRAENGNTYWAWNSLNLSGAPNQSVTLTGN